MKRCPFCHAIDSIIELRGHRECLACHMVSEACCEGAPADLVPSDDYPETGNNRSAYRSAPAMDELQRLGQEFDASPSDGYKQPLDERQVADHAVAWNTTPLTHEDWQERQARYRRWFDESLESYMERLDEIG